MCVDADTVTRRPLSELVGTIAARDLQLASIRLVPSNTTRVLGRLQAHEYRLSMRMRAVVPWLVSGACHAGETAALCEVMSHHSLFFQGNDVETGVLADAMRLRVGRVPFEVPTAVPDRIWPWWRQRLAWAGGEFRLFFVNIAIGRFHPFLWLYGLVVGILALPLRWDALITPGYALITVVALYLLLNLYIHGEHRDRWLLLMPLYSAVISLVLTPLGAMSYLQMPSPAEIGASSAHQRASKRGVASLRSRAQDHCYDVDTVIVAHLIEDQLARRASREFTQIG
ncbi:MAG: glycosyltransferase family 2 protein [Pseudonocardiaceae bacterium]